MERDPGVPLCSATMSCLLNLPCFPLSCYTLPAIWDHQGLTSPQADTHHIPSEWRHPRPPQLLPQGPWPRSSDSPLQMARRIRPLPTWLSMVRRASIVIPTNGIHCRAAEKSGAEGPRGSVRDTGDWVPSTPVRAGAVGPCRTCQRPWGGLSSPSGTQGHPLGKWERQWGAETPWVFLHQVPTLWQLGSGCQLALPRSREAQNPIDPLVLYKSS